MQKKRRVCKRKRTLTPCQGRSAMVRTYRECTRSETREQAGHAAVERQARTTIVMRFGVERICSRPSSEAEGNRGEADMGNAKQKAVSMTAFQPLFIG